LSDAIIAIRNRAGVSRQLCKVVGMSSDVLNIPKVTAGLTVDYPAEAATISDSDQVWGQVSLVAVKRAVISKVSNELLFDSVINVIDDLAVAIGNAFAVQTDNELVNGDASSTYGGESGILNSMGSSSKVNMSSGNTAFSDITLANLNALVGTMPDKYYASASPAWLIGRLAWAANIQNLIYAAGGNTLSDMAMGVAPQLLGFPVYISDQMPADAVSTCGALFGNFNDGVIIGDREDIEISVSEEAYWANDITAVKGTTRYDINVHDAGTGSAAGALVGLFTAAS